MKALTIIEAVLAAAVICGVIACLRAADEDEFEEWSEDDDIGK